MDMEFCTRAVSVFTRTFKGGDCAMTVLSITAFA